MIRFETINGQLCRMVEPTPLQLDSPMPCVVRYIQDGSPMGRYLKRKYDMVINTVIEVNRIGFDNRVYSADKTFIEEIECLEIIGYPVVEGSKEWALHQIRSGKKVVREGDGELYCGSFYQNRLFYLNGSGCLVTKNAIGLIDPCLEEEFLDLDEAGWQIYTEPEPEPQPAKEPIADCNNCKHVCTKSNIDYCHMYEPKPTYKVGDWVECDGKQGVIANFCSDDLFQDNSKCFAMHDVWGKWAGYHKVSDITRKLAPSEVIVNIGCLSGTVRRSSSSHFCIICGDHWSMIAFAMLKDATTRELVESLLKAQEKEMKDKETR